MKIINLMENTTGAHCAVAEHGFCVYVETGHHTLLMDTGASRKTWDNAALKELDLTKVDTVILSHGHYDHTGGLRSFARVNSDAAIYMNALAGGNYYNLISDRYIGIDKRILKLPSLIPVEGNLRIDEELSLFSGITGRRKWPSGNLMLKEQTEDGMIQDEFRHEQCLVLEAEGKRILFSGCAHNGILNILDRFTELYGGYPDIVISGFHMMKKEDYTPEESDLIRSVAEELTTLPTLFYTGHCTGLPAFALMKEIMGDQLIYMHCGDELDI